MKRVLVCEDEDSIREFVVINLVRSGYEVVDVNCGEDALKAYDEKDGGFDVALLDIMMPGIDGMQVCKKIREKSNTIGIIMLSAKSQEMDKISCLMSGADDYITKPFGVMELISRVKALLRRTSRMNEDSQLIHEDILMDMDKHAVTVAGQLCELTFKEFELLKYLMLNQGIVLSRDKIMDQVWGFEYEGESRTVDMHIKTLRQKLGAAGSCIKTVRNVGYMIE